MSNTKILAQLKGLSAQLKDFGTVKRTLIEGLAQETMTLIQEGFQTSTDPYGQPWVADKKGGHSPLQATGALRSGFTVTQGATGFTISNDAPGFAAHNFGWVKIPKRQMLPDSIKGLPEAWSKRLESSATHTLSDAYKMR